MYVGKFECSKVVLGLHRKFSCTASGHNDNCDCASENGDGLYRQMGPNEMAASGEPEKMEGGTEEEEKKR